MTNNQLYPNPYPQLPPGLGQSQVPLGQARVRAPMQPAPMRFAAMPNVAGFAAAPGGSWGEPTSPNLPPVATGTVILNHETTPPPGSWGQPGQGNPAEGGIGGGGMPVPWQEPPPSDTPQPPPPPPSPSPTQPVDTLHAWIAKGYINADGTINLPWGGTMPIKEAMAMWYKDRPPAANEIPPWIYQGVETMPGSPAPKYWQEFNPNMRPFVQNLYDRLVSYGLQVPTVSNMQANANYQ